MNVSYTDQNRIGDHIWYVSDTRKFQSHYPDWSYACDLRTTVEEIIESHAQRGQAAASCVPASVASILENIEPAGAASCDSVQS
jgi:CDP-paratose 2-epimerase